SGWHSDCEPALYHRGRRGNTMRTEFVRVEQCEAAKSFPSRKSVEWVITPRTLRTTSAPVRGYLDTAFITRSASTTKTRDVSRPAQTGGAPRPIRYNCTAGLGSYAFP